MPRVNRSIKLLRGELDYAQLIDDEYSRAKEQELEEIDAMLKSNTMRYDYFTFVEHYGEYIKMDDNFIRYTQDELYKAGLELIEFVEELVCSVKCTYCKNIFTGNDSELLLRFMRDGYGGCSRCRVLNRRKEKAIKAARLITEYSLPNNCCTFDKYSEAVRDLTEVTYVENIDVVNPKRLKRSLYGHNLDHILSIETCFEWRVPVELCASSENLQMLPSKMNRVKASSVPDTIPAIFESYIPTKRNTVER